MANSSPKKTAAQREQENRIVKKKTKKKKKSDLALWLPMLPLVVVILALLCYKGGKKLSEKLAKTEETDESTIADIVEEQTGEDVTKEKLQPSDPAPEPEPEPEPERAILSSGTLKSDTGTYINLSAPWRIVREDGALRLEMEVALISYSLDVGERPYGLVVTINGAEYYYNTPAIHYDGSAQTASNLASIDVSISSETPTVSLSWKFAGSYSGVELEYIEASATLGG